MPRRGQSLLTAALIATAASGPVAAISEEEALAATTRFMEAWNSRRPEAFAATLHYPHVRPSPDGGREVFADAAEYAATVDYDAVLDTGWRRSAFDQRRVVQLGADKAHVAGRYTRYRADDSPIWSQQVLYVVTRQDDSIGIQARLVVGPPLDDAAESERNNAAALAVVDRFTETFNARDMEAWAATLNYPHVRLANGALRSSATPAEYASGLDFEEFARSLNWDHSRLHSRQVVLVGADAAVVALTATRYDPSGAEIHSFDTLYLVTREPKLPHAPASWGIRARSSYAPR